MSLLWEIKHNDLPYSSYVFGTMHIRDSRAFQLVDLLKTKIDNCDLFATEINLSEAASFQLDSDYLFLPEDITIKSLLGPKKFEKLNTIFQKAYQVDLVDNNRFKPILITQKIAESIFNAESEFSLDGYLSQYANTQGKNMKGLETLEEQRDILANIPLEYQIKMLKEIGRNVKSFRKKTLKLMELYEEGAIQKLYLSSKRSLGKLKKMMLFDRNQLMVERMNPILKEGSFFCAIGAAHLSGKSGVLKGLKDLGYKLKPIYPNAPLT